MNSDAGGLPMTPGLGRSHGRFAIGVVQAAHAPTRVGGSASTARGPGDRSLRLVFPGWRQPLRSLV
ncbi:hypothetical protein SALB1_0808 [Salinisphaera sp. LB1]|nr:hypothetical protein SALB1_0808 [Salinisphaera sp. LB1]